MTGTGIAVAVSLAPSLLPRSATTQAFVTGGTVIVAWAVSAAVRRLRRKEIPPPSLETFLLAAAVTVATVGAVTCASHRWQNMLRGAMGVPSVGVLHWVEVAVVAALVVGTAAIVVHGGRFAVTLLGPRRIAAAAVSLAVVVTLGATPGGYAAAETALGDPGDHGRRFVDLPSDGSPIRVYADLRATPTVTDRAAFAVRELAHAGGFDRKHVVIAVPTGSGWIDAHAVRGFEAMWGDDVALVAQQYADTPSWVTFLFDRDAAAESARALTHAVRLHVESLPADSRPRIHVYGQSLGAVGGSDVFGDDAPGPCEAIWVGPPAGSVRTDGASIAANTSDPVVWWQPSLLWSPPELSRARRDAPVPPWIPVVGFLQVTVDLLTALDTAPGHGHRYGPDQVHCRP